MLLKQFVQHLAAKCWQVGHTSNYPHQHVINLPSCGCFELHVKGLKMYFSVITFIFWDVIINLMFKRLQLVVRFTMKHVQLQHHLH